MIAFELTLLDAALCHGISTRTWERRGLVDLLTNIDLFVPMTLQYHGRIGYTAWQTLCSVFDVNYHRFEYLRWKHAKVLAGWEASDSHHAR